MPRHNTATLATVSAAAAALQQRNDAVAK